MAETWRHPIDRILDSTPIRTRFGQPHPVSTNIDEGLWAGLVAAARKRDVSIAAYVRTAIAAFIAHDLEMPFAQAAVDLPPAPHYGQRIVPAQANWYARAAEADEDDAIAYRAQGKGYGPWEIQQLRGQTPTS